MRFPKLAVFSLALISFLSCKKSPITPSADELMRPVIWLNSYAFSFTAYESGGNPAAQVFLVKNSGKNTLKYSLSDDADWLTVEPASGTSAGQPVEHTMLVNKAGLTAGDDYQATITIVSSEAYNNPQRVSVSLKISTDPPPEIWISPQEMTFAAKVGRNPAAQTLRVRNAGMGTLTYDLTCDVPWLEVVPAGGMSGGEEKSHTVSVNSENLGEGSYEGMITVASDDASNSPRRILINLEVSENPPPPTDNVIYITCNPSSGGTGTIVSIPVSIRGNLASITTFGLDLEFEGSLFEYQNTGSGNLTRNWALVDGNIAGPGRITIGGFSGLGSAIPIGSVGSIAVVNLRVTGAGLGNGYVSPVTIKSYADDISGMQTDPYTVTFTYRQ